MSDQRDFRHDPHSNEPSDTRRGFRDDRIVTNARSGTSMWAWLAGIAAAIFIVAIIYSFSGRDDQLAVDRNTPSTTGTTGAGGTATTGGTGTAGGAGTTGTAGQAPATGGPAATPPTTGRGDSATTGAPAQRPGQ